MQRRVPSLEKLQRLIGFRPRTPLTEIVDRVVDHFQKKPDIGLPSSAGQMPSAAASL